jgi:TPR repeat protein
MKRCADGGAAAGGAKRHAAPPLAGAACAPMPNALMYQLARQGDPSDVYDYAESLWAHGSREEARAWFCRGARAGDLKAMSRYGELLVEAAGGERDFALGMYYLMQAAHQGSDHAAYVIACGFAVGRIGLPRDSQRALCWMRKVTSTAMPYRFLSADAVVRAEAWMHTLQRPSASQAS